MRTTAVVRDLLLLGSFGLLIVGCGGGSSSNSSSTGSGSGSNGGGGGTTTAPSITVAPAFGSTTSAPVALTATVSGATSSDVTWAVSGSGSVSPTTGLTTTYTPSSSVLETVKITATAKNSNGTATASAPITVNFKSTATFGAPTGIVVDSAGNVYVADINTNSIRSISVAGNVMTIGGNNLPASVDNSYGPMASFDGPAGIAIDKSGNLYVTDSNSHVIRKMTPSNGAWAVTTIAGIPYNQGNADGPANQASFNDPQGIAVDASGNVFVIQPNALRKLTPSGSTYTVSTVATDDSFSQAYGQAAGLSIAVDSSDNVYVTCSNDYTIRKVTPTGTVSIIAGISDYTGTTDGPGAQAKFTLPQGITIDGSGNLYVADNTLIRKIIVSGSTYTVSTVGVTPVNLLTTATGIALDSTGNIFVTDIPSTLYGYVDVVTNANNDIMVLAGYVLTAGGPPPGIDGTALPRQ
ncbi:MAG: hypothetical protein FWD64_03735 [Acidobacteriaceae bacterium]|nr:hypothetical protein [Acidobacteriaceae bacterium]